MRGEIFIHRRGLSVLLDMSCQWLESFSLWIDSSADLYRKIAAAIYRYGLQVCECLAGSAG